MSFDGSFESMGQKQQAAWKKFGNPVFGPASNLAVVHEIILGGVDHMHGEHPCSHPWILFFLVRFLQLFPLCFVHAALVWEGIHIAFD